MPQGKKVGVARCEYVFDVHTSKASKRLKVLLLHLWRINVKTTRRFIDILLDDFHFSHFTRAIIILRTIQFPASWEVGEYIYVTHEL